MKRRVGRTELRKQARNAKKQRRFEHYQTVRTYEKQQKKAKYFVEQPVQKREENIAVDKPKKLKRSLEIEEENDPIMAYAEAALEKGNLPSDGELSESEMDSVSEDENEFVAMAAPTKKKLLKPAIKLEETEQDKRPLSKPLVAQEDEQLKTVVRRKIQGLLNRLSTANFDGIAESIVGAFREFPRHHVIEQLVEAVLGSVCKQPNLLDSFVLTFAALIAAVGTFAGSDVPATVLEQCIDTILAPLPCEEEARFVASRAVINSITLLAFLYNLQVFTAPLIAGLIANATESLSELDIEVVVKLVRLCGAQLRRDDPTLLKEVIVQTSSRASRCADPARQENSRFRFMLETLQDLKHNRQRLVATTHDELEAAKKTLRQLTLKGNCTKFEPLAVSLDDLRNAQQRGKWWRVGAAWKGRESPEEFIPKDEKKGDGLAKKIHMNTEVRRAIFSTLMNSDDCLDAVQRLLAMNLPSRQERDIAHVLLHCCLQEKSYNPFYALVANKFLQLRRNFLITFRYALRDRLRLADEGSLSVRKADQLAKFYTDLSAAGFTMKGGSVKEQDNKEED